MNYKSKVLQFLKSKMKLPKYLDALGREYPRLNDDFLSCENYQENLQIIRARAMTCLTRRGKDVDENQAIFNLWLEILTWNIFNKNCYHLIFVEKGRNKTPDLCDENKTLLVEVKHLGAPNEDKYIKPLIWHDVWPCDKNGFNKKIGYFISDAHQKFNSFNKNYHDGFLLIYYTPSVSLEIECLSKKIDPNSNFINNNFNHQIDEKLKIFFFNTSRSSLQKNINFTRNF